VILLTDFAPVKCHKRASETAPWTTVSDSPHACQPAA